MLKPRDLTGLIFLCSFFSAAACFSQDILSKRHLIILESGVDKVWGTYLCAVENTAPAAQAATFPIVLPLEASEWQAQEGLTNENIKLHPGGGLMVQATFKPGMTLVGIAFMAEARGGSADYHFKIQSPLNEFVIMTPEDGLDLSSEQMQARKSMEFSHQLFNSLVATAPKAGDVLNVHVEGVHAGRTFYWWMAGVFAGVIFISGMVLALKTRPKGTTTWVS